MKSFRVEVRTKTGLTLQGHLVKSQGLTIKETMHSFFKNSATDGQYLVFEHSFMSGPHLEFWNGCKKSEIVFLPCSSIELIKISKEDYTNEKTTD